MKRFTLIISLLSLVAFVCAPEAQAQGGTTSTVAPYGFDGFEIGCDLGEWVRVTVIGSGLTALELSVYNLRGELVAVDVASEDLVLPDLASVAWRSDYSGPYLIVVQNLGSFPNSYLLLVE